MSGVLELLPHDMGLRVELDTNETYYLKSGWAERCDGIYGLACGYVEMRSLRRDGGHILRDMPLLRVQARQAGTVLPALPRLGREPARKGD